MAGENAPERRKEVAVSARFLAGRRTGDMRSSESYFAESARVLCGKYLSALRKARWRAPHAAAVRRAVRFPLFRVWQPVGDKKK